VSESELLESEELYDDDAESSTRFFLSNEILETFSVTSDTALCIISSDPLSSFLSDIF